MEKLITIGLFIDGGYFSRVNDHYAYNHEKRLRLDVGELLTFIKENVARKLGVKDCHIVDAHFFRGRFSAKSAQDEERLYGDRVFDEVLMRNGIQTHYLPIKDIDGKKKEKGVDVMFALEALELCIVRRFDVVVLITGDGDQLTLLRKLHAYGSRTMLLGWDLDHTDDRGKNWDIGTGKDLRNSVTYNLDMHEIMENEDVLNKLLHTPNGPSES
jgi:uncharacterized LabA/DUF88 family protein